jgi:hypothetical protein
VSKILVHSELSISAPLQKQQHIIALALVADRTEKESAMAGLSI